jgi:hypothetical protein
LRKDQVDVADLEYKIKKQEEQIKVLDEEKKFQEKEFKKQREQTLNELAAIKTKVTT